MLLSIYIPTVGRRQLFDLLLSIPAHPDIEVIVSDNSGGKAKTMCEDFSYVHYEARRYDIGRDANVLRGITQGTGEYLWVIGDDDRLLSGALDRVLDAIRTSTPPEGTGVDRLIVLTPEAAPRVSLADKVYATRDLIATLGSDASLLVAATLCSANIFRRWILDPAEGLEHFDSYYGYAHASVNAMTTRVLSEPVFECGWACAEAIEGDPAAVWRPYLDALSAATGAGPVDLDSAREWNFAGLARRHAGSSL